MKNLSKWDAAGSVFLALTLSPHFIALGFWCFQHLKDSEEPTNYFEWLFLAWFMIGSLAPIGAVWVVCWAIGVCYDYKGRGSID